MTDHAQIQLVLIGIDVIISDANSLKAKRAVLNKIKDRIKSRFNASVAEVGEQEKWQRATLAVSMLSNERKKLQADVDKLQASLLSMTEITVNQFSIEWL